MLHVLATTTHQLHHVGVPQLPQEDYLCLRSHNNKIASEPVVDLVLAAGTGMDLEGGGRGDGGTYGSSR